MGLGDSLSSFASNPARIVGAAATLGVSELARSLLPVIPGAAGLLPLPEQQLAAAQDRARRARVRLMAAQGFSSTNLTGPGAGKLPQGTDPLGAPTGGGTPAVPAPTTAGFGRVAYTPGAPMDPVSSGHRNAVSLLGGDPSILSPALGA